MDAPTICAVSFSFWSGGRCCYRIHQRGCLVLMSEIMAGLRNKFLKWKDTFESICLKVNLGKPKVLVISVITKDGMS